MCSVGAVEEVEEVKWFLSGERRRLERAITTPSDVVNGLNSCQSSHRSP
jgi:hypothetical protein